jgi:hypothetical protein
MRNTLLFALFLKACFLFSQPAIEWQRCFGGSDLDGAFAIDKTNDGGFIVAGGAYSSDGDVSGHHGNGDVWVVKLGIPGNIEWQRCYGSSGEDLARSIKQTADGGYVLAGVAGANDGDVSGGHNNIGQYFEDAWILKLDGSGNVQWQRCLGGTNYDRAYEVIETSDGGYMMVGSTYSVDGDVIGFHGQAQSERPDIWVVKLDSTGDLVWQRCLGGTESDSGQAVVESQEGGYLVSGYTRSIDGDVVGNHSVLGDAWIVKLDISGNVEWQNCMGGSGSEGSNSIRQTSDGGYISAGSTGGSFDGDVSGWHYEESVEGYYADGWIVKLDMNGGIQWQNCLGGIMDESANSIRQTDDGGFVIAGYTNSMDGAWSYENGTGLFASVNSDFWIVKLDADGDFEWQKNLGGTSAGESYLPTDQAWELQQTPDGGFILVGMTASNDGDVSGNHGLYDMWVVKLSDASFVSNADANSIWIYPNPANDYVVIHANEYLRDSHFVISDIMGNEVLSGQFSSNSITLSLQGLASGIYTLTAGNRFVTRIVKE